MDDYWMGGDALFCFQAAFDALCLLVFRLPLAGSALIALQGNQAVGKVGK